MIPFAKPWLDAEEAQATQAVIQTGWIMQGPKVEQFERAVSQYCGVSEAVAVTSCTTALHLALVSLGVGPGDEVICPSLSFIATANSIRHAGALPVFADVDRYTYNLRPDAVEAAVTPRTKAIMVVHQMGLPADLDAFLAIGRKHGIPVLEDAACALGSGYKGRLIGGHGNLTCFSFHPRKVITTGEGGMITTNDSALAERLRLLRQHGMNVSVADRDRAQRVILEKYTCIGYNYRMTDLQAAVGVEQMARVNRILHCRQRLGARYTEALSKHPWLQPPVVPEYAQPNFQSYAVQLTEDAPLERDELMQRLLDAGIATRRGIMLAHREAPYAGQPEHSNGLAESEVACDRSMLLPLFPQMTDDQQDRVIDALFNDNAGPGVAGVLR